VVFVGLAFKFVDTAVETDAVVAADNPAAVRTFPFCGLSLEKCLYAVVSNECEVVHHAHPVIGPVPFIELLETGAREVITFIAVLNLAVKQRLAMLLEEGTLFVTRAAPGAVGHVDSLVFHFEFESEIPAADGTVHAARRYQIWFHKEILA
jgi:hypothetical protein